MTETDYTDYLSRHFPVWDKLTPDQQKAMVANTKLIKYKKGTDIHKGDQDCIGVNIIQKGVLRAYMLSEEGKEITLYRLGQGDICILSASCVLSTIHFEVHITVEANSEVLLISAPFFAKLSEENIHAECFAYKQATERFSDVMWAMQQILFMSMDKRLAIFLWDELTKIQGDTIRITHEQAAKYVGSAREVVTRMLNYFASEGIVKLSRGGIKILDKNKLWQMIK